MADVSIFGHFLTLYRILGITKICLYYRRGSKLQFGGSFMKIGLEMASEISWMWGSSIVIMPGTVGYTLLPLDVTHVLLLKYTEASSLKILRHSLVVIWTHPWRHAPNPRWNCQRKKISCPNPISRFFPVFQDVIMRLPITELIFTVSSTQCQNGGGGNVWRLGMYVKNSPKMGHNKGNLLQWHKVS